MLIAIGTRETLQSARCGGLFPGVAKQKIRKSLGSTVGLNFSREGFRRWIATAQSVSVPGSEGRLIMPAGGKVFEVIHIGWRSRVAAC